MCPVPSSSLCTCKKSIKEVRAEERCGVTGVILVYSFFFFSFFDKTSASNLGESRQNSQKVAERRDFDLKGVFYD